MIEWKKYEVMRGPQFPEKKFYLVTNGHFVEVATHAHERVYGYQWWNKQHELVAGVTHYAEINLPQSV